MTKKTISILAVAVAVLLVGIGIALHSLYSGKGSETTESSGHFLAEHPLLKAVPSDAAIVFCVKDFNHVCEYINDTTAVFRELLSDKFNKITDCDYPTLRKSQAVISIHYSKDLPPLLVMDSNMAETAAATDTTASADTSADVSKLLAKAAAAGLYTKLEDGKIFISTSVTLINSSIRHLKEGDSIMESSGFASIAANAKGEDVIFVSSAYTSNILGAYFSAKHRRKADFIKELSDWTAFSISKHTDTNVSLDGEISYPDDQSCYLKVLETSAEESTIAEVVPQDADFVASLPVSNITSYLKAYRDYLDSKMKLDQYESSLRDQKELNEESAEDWAKKISIKEAGIVDLHIKDKLHQILLIRTGKKQTSVQGAIDFTYAGYAKTIFGELFTGESETSYTTIGDWILAGDSEILKEYTKNLSQTSSLKECLSENGLADRLPQKGCGFWMYYSMSEDPTLIDANFSRLMAAGFRTMTTGIPFAPATLAAMSQNGKIHLTVNFDRAAITKSKAPAAETADRDTTVVVPEGPFKVKNSDTGKMNTLYQNSHLSICLQDENGKDQWGIPFKDKICGYVQEVDFYNNGKLQYVFAAGSKLYMLDRVGRYVTGFPVDLGKRIKLGPEVLDVTGEKAYRAMILFADNTLAFMNLHGEAVEGWKGIKCNETIKSLPEVFDAAGKKYWIVRTSRQAMLFPLLGGDPVIKGDGDKMIRPESTMTINEKGSVVAKCYDGKDREFKLSK